VPGPRTDSRGNGGEQGQFHYPKLPFAPKENLMSTTDLLLAAPFVLLGLAALPLPVLRRWLLYILHGGGHVAVLAGIAACGLFAFRPDMAPDGLRDLFASAVADDYPGLAWLVKATLLLVLALPLLAQQGYALELAVHSSFLRALRKRLSALAAGADLPADKAPDGGARPYAAEMAAALEAMRNAEGTARGTRTGPRKLVKDMLNTIR
jgi:hypothetical protein